MPGKLDSFKALSAQDKRHAVVNWLLDHAMIIIRFSARSSSAFPRW